MYGPLFFRARLCQRLSFVATDRQALPANFVRPTQPMAQTERRLCRTVGRSRGSNQYWSQHYQSWGTITRQATREQNKARVMRTIMHQVGYLKPTTAAALGERAGSPRPPGSASDGGTLLDDQSFFGWELINGEQLE